MQSNLQVDRLGAAVYRLPFLAPNGTGGVKPAIEAVYNSQADNGILGKGGSLSGLSIIKRCNQTVVQDGIAKPITWTTEDRFCIDGQRLMVIAGTYGAPDSQYRTERDIGVVYTAKGGTAGNPDYFSASAADGATLTFGGDATAKELGGATMTWALSQYQDSGNNIIQYQYEGSAADGLRIKRINYAFLLPLSVVDPGASIEFIYRDRDDIQSRYVAGYEFKSTKLLSRVNTYGVMGVPYRSYQFDVSTSSGLAGIVSRWQGVDECIASSCFATTQFGWGNTQLNANNVVELKDVSIGWLGSVRHPRETTSSPKQLRLMDINGDGISDLIWSEDYTDGTATTGTFVSFDPAIIPFDAVNPQKNRIESVLSDNTLQVRPLQFADINADGVPELMLNNYNSGTVNPVALKRGRNNSYWTLSSTSLAAATGYKYNLFADLLGNGLVYQINLKSDASVTLYNSGKVTGRAVDTNNYYDIGAAISGVKFSDVAAKTTGNTVQISPASNTPGDVDLVTGDFNGDGATDVATYNVWYSQSLDKETFKLNWYSFAQNTFNLQATLYQEERAGLTTDSLGAMYDRTSLKELVAPDINGDGLSDIAFKVGSTWQYAINKGNGFTDYVQLPALTGNNYMSFSTWLVDVNRDGKLDVVRPTYNNDSTNKIYNYYVYYWDAKQNKFTDPVLLRTTNLMPMMVGDTNGDGWVDFIEYDAVAKTNTEDYLKIFGYTNSDVNVASGYPGVLAQDAITTVKTGLRDVSNIEYQSLVRANRVPVSTCTASYVSNGTSPCQDMYGVSQYQPLRFNVTIPANTLTATSVDPKPYYTKTNEPFAGLNNIYAETARVTQYIAPLPIATRIKTTRETSISNQPVSSDHKYSYWTMRTQAGGRGLLGFEKTVDEDVASGSRIETLWRQDWPYAGMWTSQNTLTSYNNLLKEQTNTLGLSVSDYQNGKVFNPNIQSNTQKNYALKSNGAEQGDLIVGGSSSSSSSANAFAPNPVVVSNSGTSSSASAVLPPTPMQSNLQVDRLGAAVYRLPFLAPNGTGGVKPAIEAVYNSQADNGVLGKGGSLSGLSIIKRCNQTVVQDGIAKPITWTTEDRFCIDGQRLMVIAGTYGAPDSQYRTERDIGVVYTAKGGTAGNPDYFSASAADGATLTFGGDASAKELGGATMTWALSQYQDSGNNIIQYQYEGSAADGLRIKRINYAFLLPLSVVDPGASIEFIYRDRDDIQSRYVAGYEFKSTKLLSRVNTYGVMGVPYRSYQFDVSTSTGLAGIVSRWQGVDECIASSCFATTQFGWGNTQLNANNVVELKDVSIGWLGSVRHPRETTSSPKQLRLMDINGDGISDLIWSEDYTDGTATTGTFVSFDPAIIPFDAVNPQRTRTEAVPSDNAMQVRPLQFADINADGVAEIVSNNYSSGTVTPVMQKRGRNNNNWTLSDVSMTATSGYRYNLFADLLGNGLVYQINLKSDASVTLYNSGKVTGRAVDTNNYYDIGAAISGVKFSDVAAKTTGNTVQISPASNTPGDVDLITGDFNGDGATDVATYNVWYSQSLDKETFKLNWYSFAQNTFNLQATLYQEERAGLTTDSLGAMYDRTSLKELAAPDINGDGLSDIAFKVGNTWQYAINKGNGFSSYVQLPALTGNNYMSYSAWLVDVNRDGKLDVVRPTYNNDNTNKIYNYYVYYWDAKQNKFTDPVLLRTTNLMPMMVGDTNGDGWVDFIEYDSVAKTNNVEYIKIFGYTNSDVNVASGYPGVLAQDTITTVKTGLRDVSSIEYQSLVRPNRVPVSTCSSVNTGAGPTSPCQDMYGISQYQPLRFNVALPAGSLTATSVETKPYYTKTNEPFAGLNNIYAETARVTQYIAPLPIATRIKTTRETSITNQPVSSDHKYSYWTMRTQAGGRGLLGFEKTVDEDVAGGIRIETLWRQDWPYSGMVAKITRINSQNVVMNEAENALGLAVSDNNGSKVFTPSLISQIVKTYAQTSTVGEAGELLKAVKYSGATAVDSSMADGQATINYGTSQGAPVSVELTAPGESAVLNYAFGETIGLSAVVKAADGTVWRDTDGLPPKVVFYDYWYQSTINDDKRYQQLAIGMGDGKPVSWTPEAQGIHVIRAKAYLNNGNVLYSNYAGVLISRPSGTPYIRMGAPINGVEIALNYLSNFYVEASDEDGISNITYYANDNPIGVITAPITAGGNMYRLDWQPTVPGVYKIYAVVKDTLGNVSKTKTASAYVGVAPPVNQIPPIVNSAPYLSMPLSYPAFYYELGNTVYLASALRGADGAQWKEDDNSIPRVKFYADDVNVGESAASGYMAEWIPTAAAAYKVTGISVLKNGQQIVSPPATLLMGQPNAPRTQLTAPVYSGMSYRQGTIVPISVNATAMGSAKITKVTFYANGEEIGSDTTAPYSLAWNPPALGLYKIRAVATDSLGVTGLSAQREIRYIDAAVESTANTLANLAPPSLTALMPNIDSVFDGMSASFRVKAVNAVVPSNSVLELFETAEQDTAWSNTPIATYDLQRNTLSSTAGVSLSVGSSSAAATFILPAKNQANYGYRARICTKDTFNCSAFSTLLTVNIKIFSSASSSPISLSSSSSRSSSSAPMTSNSSAAVSSNNSATSTTNTNSSATNSSANSGGASTSSSASSLGYVTYIYPAQGAPIPYVGTDPCFQWSKAAGATSYQLVLGSNEYFSGEVWKKQVGLSESDCWNDGMGWTANTSNKAPYKLTIGQNYYWKVIASGATGKTEVTPRYFSLAKLAIPDAPVLTAPTQALGSFQLSWVPAAGTMATFYNIKEKTNGVVTFYNNITATNYVLNPQLFNVYEYSIQACNNNGCSAYSDVRRTMFNGLATLDSPVLVAPADQAILAVSSANPCFQWNPVAGATGYNVTINTDGHFPISRWQRLNTTGTSLCWNSGTDWTAAGQQPPTEKVLREGVVYYWRIVAVKPNGEAYGFSETRRFRLSASSTVVPDAPLAINVQPNQSSGTFGISWRAVADAVNYELQRASGDRFTVYGSEWSAGETFTVTNTVASGFASSNVYMWRVRACNAAKLCSDWKVSDPKVFQLPSSGTAATLSYPPNNMIMEGNPCFDWVAPSNAATATITLSLSNYFPAQRWARDVTGSSRVCWDGGVNWTPAGLGQVPTPANLAQGLPYNWRVVTGDGLGGQAFSETRSFVVANDSPTNPSLTTPTLTAEDVDADCFFIINMGAPANVPVDHVYELYEHRVGQSSGWQLLVSRSRMFGNVPPFKLYSDADVFKNRTPGGNYEYKARVCKGNECGATQEFPLNINTSYNCAAIATPTVKFNPAISYAVVGQANKLNVDASISSGSIASVKFIAGGVTLGTVTTAPYALDWTPAQLGSTYIEAIAEGTNGGTASTHYVAVNVVDAPQVTSSATASSAVASTGANSSEQSSAGVGEDDYVEKSYKVVGLTIEPASGKISVDFLSVTQEPLSCSTALLNEYLPINGVLSQLTDAIRTGGYLTIKMFHDRGVCNIYSVKTQQ